MSIKTKTLITEATASEHKEAYKTLDKNKEYRIGAGARITSPNHPIFFIEILIYLTHDYDKADIEVLEKGLTCTKALQERKFKTVFQDDNCISCETEVSEEKLESEYERTKALVQSIFAT